MKSTLQVLTVLLFVALSPLYGQSDFYPKRWSEVYRYELKALPKSALAVVDTIYLRAKREGNVEQFIKALLYQSKFALSLSENAELQIIDRFKKEISESSSPQRNILESILGSLYWQYFQGNRWQYYQRTRTAEKVNETDFRTWDAAAVFREIDLHFRNSLENAQLLQGLDLATINDILIQAENSKAYRPTVYDFLAHNALAFYRTNESMLSSPRESFALQDTLYFKDFEDLPLAEGDSVAPHLKALRIFQRLLSFHKVAKDTDAYVNLEIDRLKFITGEGRFDNGVELQKKALEDLKSAYQHHPASALAGFELATILLREGSRYRPIQGEVYQFRKRDALALCDEVIARFPESDGGRRCQLLRENILASRIYLAVEHFIPVNTHSRIQVGYSNARKLKFSVFRVTGEYELRFNNEMSDSLRRTELARLNAVTDWETGLTDLGDYQEHETEVVMPALSQGRYLVVARGDDRPEGEEVFAYGFVQVTNLAMMQSSFSRDYRFRVVDRNSGRPIEGANVHMKTITYPSIVYEIDKRFTTDRHGSFEVENPEGYIPNIQATVTFQGDTAVFGRYSMNVNYDGKDETEDQFLAKTFLFTDRSIYRPGQTVYFKGILIRTRDQKSAVVPGEWVEVFLIDVNGEEAGTLRLKTNAYGSFSGEFQLPSSGLTGAYSLYADEDSEEGSKFYDKLSSFEYDEVSISVEEYKRPTFEVSFAAVKESFRLNDTITVKGEALAFSGAKAGGAKIRYHVKRTARFPRWFSWSFNTRYSEEELVFGEDVTGHDGGFSVKFAAIPDSGIPAESRPVFQYEVSVDVTDINGETRSASTVIKVGYHSMTATISAPQIVDKRVAEHKMSITTENLNGEFLAAKGTVQIFKLQAPASPIRPRPWLAPDLPLIEEDEFERLFPHDAYKDNIDPDKWPKGELVLEIPFDTKASKEIGYRVSPAWEPGKYVIELSTADPNGLAVRDILPFTVFDPQSKIVADQQLLVFETDKMVYKVGDVVRLKIGSASPDITLIVDVERDEEIAQTFVEHLQNGLREIAIPVTDAMAEGFSIHCNAVNFNSFISERKNISVVPESLNMEIETITFKDKIQPGARETWSFSIKGEGAAQKTVEVLASMYDASLDQFRSHEWYFNPVVQRGYYSYHRTSADESFYTQPFSVSDPGQRNFDIPRQYYDDLDWFGFSITNAYYLQRKYLERLYFAGIDADSPSEVRMSNAKDRKDGYVYGTIRTDDGDPLPGVNVVIKGTDRGTVTDGAGSYMIEANRGDVIVFSFIGFSTAEAKVGRKNTINVIMKEEVMALSEIVVTAMGVEVKKRELGYSVSEVVFESDTTATEAEYAYSLSAPVVAGLGITGTDQGTAYLMIRGNTSMNPGDRPLYVVDGDLVESSEISQDDLAHIQVLKGAAATALYGARAVNGVIIVTTKSGQKKLDEELAKVSTRKDFNETAFFFPHLTTDETGKIRFTFTSPESLTRWKLQLLAHTTDLVTSKKTLQTVTQKELMVTPNAPRFLRAGDEITFVAKISNLTAKAKEGKVALQLSDAVTGRSIDVEFGNAARNQSFKAGAKASAEVSWKLKVPPGVDAIQYKVVAKAGNFSDGEQNVLPVLSNRMLVTETLPMYVRSGQTKEFTLDKLRALESETLEHHQLTLEVTSNPAWYAIQALPYLIEFPHECSEQIFSRYYANSLASHIATSNPAIREVFDQWSSSDALVSNLEKNSELKSILIEETPWLRDAQSESEQRKRIGLLFEINKLKDLLRGTVVKLQNMQMPNGGFPWFAGGDYPSRYITQHIVSGFGHLKQLKVAVDQDEVRDIVANALRYLDAEIADDYRELQAAANAIRLNAGSRQQGEESAKSYLAQRHAGNNQIQYLYMRSFFPDIEMSKDAQVALEYYRKQSMDHWQDFNLYLKGMIALIHHRNGNARLPKEILRSLKENSIASDEMGMYWKENRAGWYWHESPVETQSLLIEAFSEIESADTTLTFEDKQKTIDELRIWLLKNKQTSQWKTTKATTEAIYALLLNGTEWLPLDKQVDVSVGDRKVTPDPASAEAGTGYYKTTWDGDAVTPDMAHVTLAKKGEGVAWGGLYWQYFEDLDRITAAGTPLALTKKVFVVGRTGEGELMSEVTPGVPLHVGDLLRIRIELRADRPMEFLHMKDMRAAGLEPVDVLSAYKWQEGLGYYQSTKDASTHFFFDQMSPGVYVFEYDLRVNNAGNFSNGITTIQSMYAPEFSSHSEGVRISVE